MHAGPVAVSNQQDTLNYVTRLTFRCQFVPADLVHIVHGVHIVTARERGQLHLHCTHKHTECIRTRAAHTTHSTYCQQEGLHDKVMAVGCKASMAAGEKMHRQH